MRSLFRGALFAGILACLVLCGCSGGPSKKEVVKLQADLASTDPSVRQNALVELAKAKDNAVSAVPDIAKALDDQDPVNRRLAAYALGEIGPKAKAAVPQLNAHRMDPDMTVITACVNALKNIQPEEVKGVGTVNVTQ